jgi:hypothetical protein
MLRKEIALTYRSCFHASILIVFAALVSTVAQESRTPPSSFRFDNPLSFLGITAFQELQQAVTEIDSGSEVKRVMLISRLKEKLADESPISLSGYSVGTERYDLTKVSGRARWLIEHILQREIGNSSLSVDERIKLWQVSASQRRLVIERTVPELKQKYAGTIRSGIVSNMALPSVDAMDRLLEDWFPYARRIADLEEITGVSFARERDDAVLLIDSGIFGAQYRFRLNNGVIDAVFKESLE